MKIGCLKEIKKHEYRVGMTPSDVKSYLIRGHQVFIEKNAGMAAGFNDKQYEMEGAILHDNRKDIFDTCDMIVKVKEPMKRYVVEFG